MSTAALQRRPLGQILISEGILSEDQLRIALLEQMKQNQPIGKLLVSLGFVTEATLRQALSENLGKQSIDLSHAVIDPQALKLVPRDLAKRHHLLPLDYDRNNRRLALAISDIRSVNKYAPGAATASKVHTNGLPGRTSQPPSNNIKVAMGATLRRKLSTILNRSNQPRRFRRHCPPSGKDKPSVHRLGGRVALRC